jgi:hypothetical protein
MLSRYPFHSVRPIITGKSVWYKPATSVSEHNTIIIPGGKPFYNDYHKKVQPDA